PQPPTTCAGSPPPCKKCDTSTGTFVADSSKDGTSCADTASSFTASGVNVIIDASCNGSCSAGSCNTSGLGFKTSDVKNGVTDALAKIFDACVGDPLKTSMRNVLKTNGTQIACAANPAGSTDCA